MKWNYFQIGIYIKNRHKPFKGVRKYLTDNADEVYQGIKAQTLKYYLESDIIKIDVWILTEASRELKQYLSPQADSDLSLIN